MATVQSRKVGYHLHKYCKRWISQSQSTVKQVEKKYGVLITGGPPDHIQQFGDYGDMMINMLGDNDNMSTNEKWSKYYCMHNEFPSNDELSDLSGVVVTGSRFDAHGNDEWICNLREIIRNLYSNKNKQNNYCRILGICFGHQLISNSLNGISGPTKVGWQLGVQHIDLNQEFYKLFPEFETNDIKSLPILKLHQDQVHKLPTDAVLLASSCNTPIEMYRINDNVLCVQGHPEFDKDYLKQVIKYRNEGGIIPDENAQICMESIKDPSTYSNINLWHKLLRSWLIG